MYGSEPDIIVNDVHEVLTSESLRQCKWIIICAITKLEKIRNDRLKQEQMCMLALEPVELRHEYGMNT